MLSLIECTNISEKVFLDPKTLEECRLKPQFFTRNRELPFPRVLKYLISFRKGTTQNALDDFFATEGMKKSVSQQALSKARNKFTALPFKNAFDAIVSASYDDVHRSDLERFNGKFHSNRRLTCSSPEYS